MRTAVCSGSFDPITLGHLDVICRAAACFDRVVVCVSPNAEKRSQMFTPEQKLRLVRAAVAELPNVEAELWPGLLADFAAAHGAGVIVRGVRNVTDFDAESRTGDHAAACRAGVPAFQLLHGPGDDPLPPAAGEIPAHVHCADGAGDDGKSERIGTYGQ